MSEQELQQLQNMVRAVVTRVLAERRQPATGNRQSAVLAAKPIGRILVGVCCGECLSDEAQAALDALRQSNFELLQPDESEFKKRSEREQLVAAASGVLLPALGDDDAGKMAMGIFDEPVARLALTALASEKPVWAAIHSPYKKAIQKRAPALSRVWDGHRRLLDSYGIQVIEYSRLAQTVRAGLQGATSAPLASSNITSNGKRVLISVREVEAASKNGARLQLPPGAIVTPLARDRAKELGVSIG